MNVLAKLAAMAAVAFAPLTAHAQSCDTLSFGNLSFDGQSFSDQFNGCNNLDLNGFNSSAATPVPSRGVRLAQAFNFQDVDQFVEQLCQQNGVDCMGNQSASNVSTVTQSSSD